MRAVLILLGLAAAGAGLAACGTDDKTGTVGDTFSVDHLRVTVDRVDAHVPVPAHDVTGLSQPRPGARLFGAHVRVCPSDVGAVNPTSFGLDVSGGSATLKYPERNYDHGYDAVRTRCGRGWVVFEVPDGADVRRVTFSFENTGSSSYNRDGQDEVSVHFAWAVP